MIFPSSYRINVLAKKISLQAPRAPLVIKFVERANGFLALTREEKKKPQTMARFRSVNKRVTINFPESRLITGHVSQRTLRALCDRCPRANLRWKLFSRIKFYYR